MRWQEFEMAAPGLAAAGRERLERARLAMLGTIRADGSPRISPIEPNLVLGHLLLGMEWPTGKARDVLRDPRCTLHSIVTDPDGQDGEFKLYGRALPAEQALVDGDYEAWWHARQPAGFRVFWFDIESAALIGWDLGCDEMTMSRWTPEGGEVEVRRPRPG